MWAILKHYTMNTIVTISLCSLLAVYVTIVESAAIGAPAATLTTDDPSANMTREEFAEFMIRAREKNALRAKELMAERSDIHSQVYRDDDDLAWEDSDLAVPFGAGTMENELNLRNDHLNSDDDGDFIEIEPSEYAKNPNIHHTFSDSDETHIVY